MSFDAFSDRSATTIHRILADRAIDGTVPAVSTGRAKSAPRWVDAISTLIRKVQQSLTDPGELVSPATARVFPLSLKTTDAYFADVAITNFEVVTGLKFDDRMMPLPDHDHVMLLQRAGTIGRQLSDDQISPNAAAASLGKLISLTATR